MGNRPLIVAGIAAALLVVVLGVDATMGVTYSVDVWTGTAWRELARDPYSYDERAVVPYGFTTISANRSDDIQFRLRVENTYAWGVSDSYRAYQNGEEVASGTLDAAARTNAEHTFDVPAARYFDPSLRGEPAPGKATPTTPYVVSGDLQIQLDGRALYVNFQIQEVSK